MPIPDRVDQIIDARWVIPVEPSGRVLERHSVVVHDGRVRDLLPTEDAHQAYAAEDWIRLGDHALIPGLINLHTHAAMALMRGLADDLPLMDWLSHHIWPAEKRHVAPAFVEDGTLLACAEMLRGGVTCFNDMYFFPEMTARAALRAGMRAAVGLIVLEFPTAYASDAEDYLRLGLAARDELKHEPLLSFCFAPHAPYTVSDRSFEQVLTLADQLDLPIHIHLHETDDELRQSVERHGARPLERLNGLGLVGPGLIAVHAVHLTPDEIALLGQRGAAVAHCPTSNLKLASGIAPLAALLAAGVTVGLGTDGAASNNRLDLLEEMRLAALLAKAQAGRADAVSAEQALTMVTLRAAQALGLDREIGSIVRGKSADLCAVNLSALELSPLYDPVSHLVYCAGRDQVTHVWVQGRALVADRRLLTLDETELKAKAAFWQRRLAEQA